MQQPAPDNANVLAPAPVFFVAAVAIGFALEYAFPSASLSFKYATVVGIAFVVISVALVVSASAQLVRAKTAFDARKSTTSIVTTGAFRISRNPTYLSLALLQVGLAFLFQSFWVLVTVAAAVAITHWGVVLREERYLEQKFGAEYARYSAKVRRWL
jgi:protein-S-isoprenylcysteine O-methyltransferase Ste14